MTTTMRTLETDKVVDEPVADPAVEQQCKAIDEATAAGDVPMATVVEAQLPTRRGPQRAPKSWRRAVLCCLGMHEGQWAYVAEGDCDQGRECVRCGSVHVRTEHQREWRYIRAGACQQVRRCGRCNVPNGGRTNHEWGEDYDIPTLWWQGDREGHRCLRCGEVEEWSNNDVD